MNRLEKKERTERAVHTKQNRTQRGSSTCAVPMMEQTNELGKNRCQDNILLFIFL